MRDKNGDLVGLEIDVAKTVAEYNSRIQEAEASGWLAERLLAERP